MDFLEWLRLKAPGSVLDYARYFSRFEEELSSLEFSRLPCNSWVLKLAGNYVEWLLAEGRIPLQVYALKRYELRARARLCGSLRRQYGMERCPGSLRVPAELRWVARALLESGTRLKHLWLVRGVRPERYGDVIVWDLNRRLGTKRVNVIVLHEDTAARVAWLVDNTSYERVKDRGRGLGFSCLRKYHYNLCLAASRRDRLLCDFIQGRSKPVSVVHYEEYKANAAILSKKIWVGGWAMLRGASLGEAIRLVRDLVDNPSPRRVEPDYQGVAGPQLQGPGEVDRDIDPEVLSMLSLYSDRLD